MDTRTSLITVADAYCAHTGRGRGSVSAIILNRGSTLDQIADGRGDIVTRSFDRSMAWFSANWPEGLAWPSGVHRPDPHLSASSSDEGENGAGATSCHVESATAIPHAEVAR